MCVCTAYDEAVTGMIAPHPCLFQYISCLHAHFHRNTTRAYDEGCLYTILINHVIMM